MNFEQDKHIYIIDFLNIFSDYREVFYKKQGIDFHSKKTENLKQDLSSFLRFFFTSYLSFMKINIDKSCFVFVSKKITFCDRIIKKEMLLYKKVDIRFLIIENKFLNFLIDKNKDDYICQYLFCLLKYKYNCTLISNDHFRDKNTYMNLMLVPFTLNQIKVKEEKVENKKFYIEEKEIKQMNIIINNTLCFNFKAIPKNQLTLKI